MKGKVLSVRISEKDLASCVELCNSVHLKPIGMGGYLTKTLGILLENLRRAHKVMSMSDSQVHEMLKQTFGDREVGYSCELPDNFADFTIQSPQVPHFNLTSTDLAQHAVKLAYPNSDVQLSHFEEEQLPIDTSSYNNDTEDSLKFDQDLEEEIRLSAMLEGENLIDKLLVTEHRADDNEVKLMNPDLAGPVPAVKNDETE